MNQREQFFRFLGQTSPTPMALEIERAEGSWLFDNSGKKYLDLISGISVSNIGHRHPQVVKAVKDQADRYMHLMVYGEYIQAPQVKLAEKITELSGLNDAAVYLVNSGSEATEGAMKAAKRFTGRSEILYFKNSYHGSTQGALSILGEESMKESFRPLLPGCRQIQLNDPSAVEEISESTAAVFWEPVQGEAGVQWTEPSFARALRKKCDQTGALLIADEIQSGMGRTGKCFAFDHFEIKPDMFLTAKGLGGGMPIGAFAGRKEILDALTNNPVLGHITTFGGHPVSAAAALAAIEVMVQDRLVAGVSAKSKQLLDRLNRNPAVEDVRSAGLMMSVKLKGVDEVFGICSELVSKGVVADWFLFATDRIRIAPPLNISEEEINFACDIFDEVTAQL